MAMMCVSLCMGMQARMLTNSEYCIAWVLGNYYNFILLHGKDRQYDKLLKIERIRIILRNSSFCNFDISGLLEKLNNMPINT